MVLDVETARRFVTAFDGPRKSVQDAKKEITNAIRHLEVYKKENLQNRPYKETFTKHIDLEIKINSLINKKIESTFSSIAQAESKFEITQLQVNLVRLLKQERNLLKLILGEFGNIDLVLKEKENLIAKLHFAQKNYEDVRIQARSFFETVRPFSIFKMDRHPTHEVCLLPKDTLGNGDIFPENMTPVRESEFKDPGIIGLSIGHSVNFQSSLTKIISVRIPTLGEAQYIIDSYTKAYAGALEKYRLTEHGPIWDGDFFNNRWM